MEEGRRSQSMALKTEDQRLN